MELKVIKPFDWAHKGVRVESFEKGQIINTEDEDLIRVSLDEKWTSKAKAGSESRTSGEASENNAMSGAQEQQQIEGDQRNP